MTRLEKIVELGFARIGASIEAAIEKNEAEMKFPDQEFKLDYFLKKHLSKLKGYDEI